VSPLPNWIATRIDRDLDKTLTQDHVIEVMVDAERPFFSARQIQARVKPDVSVATVRNRLDELQELDVVATETYPDAVTLYYIDYPESNWPLSPEGRHALRTATPLDRLSVGVLGLSDTVGSRPTVLAGLAGSLALFALGVVVSAVGVGFLLDTNGLVDQVGALLAAGGVLLWTTAVQAGLFYLALVATDRTLG
jgi:hypothetical protein